MRQVKPKVQAHLLLVGGSIAFGLTGMIISGCSCNFVSLFGKTKQLAMVLQEASPIVDVFSVALAPRYVGAFGR